MKVFFKIEADGKSYGTHAFSKKPEVGQEFTFSVNPSCAASKQIRARVISIKPGTLVQDGIIYAEKI